MKNSYQKIFDKIEFSADFERRTINYLTSDPKILEQNSFAKKNRFPLLSLCITVSACIICIFFLARYNLRDTDADISISKEPTEYKYYGDDIIFTPENDIFVLDDSCTIRLEHIQDLPISGKLKMIYLFNCDQKIIEAEFSGDTETIEYMTAQGGAYSIYALTTEGNYVSLKSYISIDYVSNYRIDKEEADEPSVTDGLIYL